jgi:diguanylate cyclase (GGDEF)-like protein/PAS domain S-box-containing protein
MEETELRLVVAMGAAEMAIWDSTIVDGKIVDGVIYWSGPGAALIGLEPRAYTQPFSDFLALVTPSDRERMVGVMQAGVDRRDGYELEYCIEPSSGDKRWLAARALIICDSDRMPVRTLGMVWSVTARVMQEAMNEERELLAEVTLFALGDGVIRTDNSGKVTFINRAAETLTGWTVANAYGLDVELVMPLVHRENGETLEHTIRKSIVQQQTIGVSTHTQLVSRSGKRIDIEDSAAPIWSKDGLLLGSVIVFRDVGHERRLAHQLSWQATHDALTGLINRVEFETRVAAALRLSKDEGQVHALLYLDLDRFKVVNDTCGHGAGDILLKLLAQMLHSHMRDSDILARLGGDELGALLLQCPLPRANQIADELRKAVNDFRFVWEERTFELGVSIGLVEINEDSVSTTELLIASDQACYLAKELGRNRIHVYRESDIMLAQRRGEMKWLARLHEAFDMHYFQLYAMPIVNLNDASERHDEILIRMSSITGELTLPGAFIPAAERYDLMFQIDKWVVAAVCTFIANQRRPNLIGSHLATLQRASMYSINLSGVSLNQPGFDNYIVEQFSKHGISPDQICFEITETAVIANLPKAQLFMEKLKLIGCRFSLDDFGSGLSSFGYLKSLPVDYLKIDGLFVRDIAHNSVNKAMVRAINDVGHVMNIKTVAEYVEDEETLRSVKEIGVDYAQGHAVGGLRMLNLDVHV